MALFASYSSHSLMSFCSFKSTLSIWFFSAVKIDFMSDDSFLALFESDFSPSFAYSLTGVFSIVNRSSSAFFLALKKVKVV